MRYVSALAVIVAGLCTVTAGSQQPQESSSKLLVQRVGLPAIDRGLRDGDLPRAARTRAHAERVQRDGVDRLPYAAGSIIVRFKDDAEPFDLVSIPDGADPEAAAAAMRARADVEYAQPRYRNHALSRPNDTLYANQWNFPAIDMERAWDIQPGASSSIVVAVLDSGMAFETVTIGYTSRSSFRPTPGGPL